MNRRNALVGAMAAIAAMAMPMAGHAKKIVVDVSVAPPPQRVEAVPAPRAGYVWAPGYWRWDRGRHVWVNGYWVRERRGYHWVPHRWKEHGKRWHFEAGHWDRDKARAKGTSGKVEARATVRGLTPLEVAPGEKATYAARGVDPSGIITG